MLKRNSEKIKNSMRKITESLKPIEEKIIELDENFHTTRVWIEKESDFNSFIDLNILYENHPELLGLKKAKKRLLKKEDITEVLIADSIMDLPRFKNMLPETIKEIISIYLEKRIKLSAKIIKNSQKRFKTLY